MRRSIRLARAAAVILFSFALLLPLTGCDRPGIGKRHEPQLIRVLSPEFQAGRSGQPAPRKVVVEVLSAPEAGLLGGTGDRHSVPGIRLLVRPADPASGLAPSIREGLTDAGGRLAFEVTLGPTFGDQYLDVVCATAPAVKARLRFLAGVEISGDRQETKAGEALSEPLQLALTDGGGAPLPDVPVFFSFTRQPGKGGKLSQSRVVTGEDGIAETGLLTDPDATGRYEILAEVADPKGGHVARGLRLEAMALNPLGLLVGVIGGLAVFIFGMTMMSDGLQQIAGSRLKSVLHFFTRNRVSGVLAGASITGLIQSSSACTVMVVGFVNAGLLSLKQAVGVIFGANIGTTVTGQMVSFNLEGLALPAIAVGVVLMMLLKKSAGRGLARTLIGFGLLFFGMGMMSAELKSISAFPSFSAFFHTFDCSPGADGRMPLLAVLGAVGIGTLLTVIVQSSSATIGLTIALAGSGLIDIWTAVPLVLGDNIGTTITAILASINANRSARQAALAHTLFNVLGTVIMILLFFVPLDGVPVFIQVVNSITAGDVFLGENVGRHVAAAHSLFNIVNVIIFLPLLGGLVWICERAIPARKAEAERVQRLEPHLLATPALALSQAVACTTDMADKAWRLAHDSLLGFRRGQGGDKEALFKTENEVDDMQGEIIRYLVELTRRELSETQSKAIPLLMHCVNDAERVADLAVAIAGLTGELAPSESFSASAQQEMDELIAATSQLAELLLEGLRTGNEGALARALKVEGQINSLCKQSEQHHVSRLTSHECAVGRGIVYVEMLANLERIADHLVNIAERAPHILNQEDAT
ncbi:MAG: Na/Pi symporter [Lentisphaeria bacterium]